MNTDSVTFETKCWEADWEILLKTNYLEKQINYCNYSFSKKRLIINNVNDRRIVQKYAEIAIKKGIIDEFVFADDYADRALNICGLSMEELGAGYVYSICELVGICLCDTEFLIHFSSDSRFELKNKFVKDAVQIMKRNPSIMVASPMWNYQYRSFKPHWDKDHKFHLGKGFSDQCYLIRPVEFKKDIYHFTHSNGENFPEYGGELFEKRCDAYIRNNDRLRAVYMKASYWSENLRGIENYQKKSRVEAVIRRVQSFIS